MSEIEFIVRDARPSDCHSIHSLICELAEYEKMPDQVEITAERLKEDGFGHDHEPRFHCLVVENLSIKTVVGFLLYVQKYSTWKGAFLWMEDLYIQPKYRRLGLGRSLVCTLIRKAYHQQMPRIEWNVLGWNQLAREFYHEKLGAIDLTHDDDWLTYRLHKNRFEHLLQLNPSNVRIDVYEKSTK